MGFHAQISCRNCHTTRTPLWRAGPDGPRSLCNACGLRYRKRRRALLGLDKGGAEKCMKRNRTNKILTDLDRSLGRRSKLKEDEEAAMLLMALSDASLCTY